MQIFSSHKENNDLAGLVRPDLHTQGGRAPPSQIVGSRGALGWTQRRNENETRRPLPTHEPIHERIPRAPSTEGVEEAKREADCAPRRKDHTLRYDL